jgi:hypothetical protein
MVAMVTYIIDPSTHLTLFGNYNKYILIGRRKKLMIGEIIISLILA